MCPPWSTCLKHCTSNLATGEAMLHLILHCAHPNILKSTSSPSFRHAVILSCFNQSSRGGVVPQPGHVGVRQ